MKKIVLTAIIMSLPLSFTGIDGLSVTGPDIASLPAQNIFQNPAALEAKVMERVLISFPYIAKIYPNQSATASLTNANTRGLRFYIGQNEARDLIQYEKIIANIAYTQTNPRTEYLKEERQGVFDFYIFANEVEVTVDVRPNFPMWQQSAIQLADAYNAQQYEKRRLAVANNTRTSQAFQSKRSYPGQTWSDYMTAMEDYYYAVAEDRDYLGAKGEMLAYINKCLTSGYPLEYYNGLVYRTFQGDVPVEIEARARLVRGNNEILMRINTKAQKNHGLPDRILQIQQVDALMTNLVKIVLEEIGETPPAVTDPPGSPYQPVTPTPITEDEPENDDQLIYETPNYIAILGATILGFNFFEGGENGVPYGARRYNTKFSRSEVRHIWWELDLKHEAIDARRAVYSNAYLYGPKGDPIDMVPLDIVINPGLERSQNSSILSIHKQGLWEPGKYRVELYIFFVKFATREFIITN